MYNELPTLVILAGGSSSRLWPLDDKAMLKFNDKTLLEQQLETYVDIGFKKVIIICNPANRTSFEHILANYSDEISVRIFVQEEPRGMGDALLQLSPLLAERSAPFPVYICQVHDIFEERLHREMIAKYQTAPQTTWLASYKVSEYFPGGYLEVDNKLNIHNIIEKPTPGQEPSDLVNIVAHLHPDLHLLLKNIRQEYTRDIPTDDHYERAMAQMMTQQVFKAVPYAGTWCPIKYPWHVLGAMNYHLKKLESVLIPDKLKRGNSHVESGAYVGERVRWGNNSIIRQSADIRGNIYIADDVTIEDGVHISGPAYIGAGTRLFHGADIRGPVYIGGKCLVGQYANVRQSMVSCQSIVGANSEVNRSYIGKGANMHAAMVLDSIIADSSAESQPTNMSAGVITANLRADFNNIKTTVKGQRLSTDRGKLGAVIGAGAFVAVNVMLMPGIKIGKGCFVGPSTVVIEDVADYTRIYTKPSYSKKPLRE
jgi:UDP-N-acetylglucosamine diphosphorylase / glucose-1-phosphate thymidylyltransferase / UDP-N-acetylgalactosamine diphosphorylase / glucosamine-1-phosphate N-acetyltransferase / galactosamine-1-phosphate N-acetyltransferase